ncbi:hypothetical protein VTJ04DRAFT_1297 [Mycothermus thermophilus]|uniref:uncharacterized protein n=1 Tax=Humicola insolens TaxID=85995 RepID=UPI003742DE12
MQLTNSFMATILPLLLTGIPSATCHPVGSVTGTAAAVESTPTTVAKAACADAVTTTTTVIAAESTPTTIPSSAEEEVTAQFAADIDEPEVLAKVYDTPEDKDPANNNGNVKRQFGRPPPPPPGRGGFRRPPPPPPPRRPAPAPARRPPPAPARPGGGIGGAIGGAIGRLLTPAPAGWAGEGQAVQGLNGTFKLRLLEGGREGMLWRGVVEES